MQELSVNHQASIKVLVLFRQLIHIEPLQTCKSRLFPSSISPQSHMCCTMSACIVRQAVQLLRMASQRDAAATTTPLSSIFQIILYLTLGSYLSIRTTCYSARASELIMSRAVIFKIRCRISWLWTWPLHFALKRQFAKSLDNTSR